MSFPIWDLDESKILPRRELATVLAVVPRSANQRAIESSFAWRPAAGYACRRLKRCEWTVGGGVPRPYLRLRRETTKGKRPRTVPLWWDAGTLEDPMAWKAERAGQGAGEHDPFVCSVQANRRGEPLQRAAVRRRFQSACKVLG
jgi:hypothetical protein